MKKTKNKKNPDDRKKRSSHEVRVVSTETGTEMGKVCERWVLSRE